MSQSLPNSEADAIRFNFAYGVLADLLAVFWTLAGSLKLLPFLVSGDMDVLFIVGGVAEISLGFWWAVEYRQRMRFFATILLLVVLGGFGIWFIAQGRTNCGCFGLIQTRPVVSLSIAGCIFVAVVLFQKHLLCGIRKPVSERLTIGAIAGLIMGVGVFSFLDDDGLINGWYDSGVSLAPAVLEYRYDPVTPVSFSGEVTVSNNAPRPVTIVGFSNRDGCTSFQVQGLPLELPANGTGVLRVVFDDLATNEEIEKVVGVMRDSRAPLPEASENTIAFFTNHSGNENKIILKINESYDLEQMRKLLGR